MYKVLLVDDEKLTREAIGQNMPWGENGFELVGMAENGREAITIIEEKVPDLVLTDICMPVMDGLALSEFLYEHYPQIKIVIISGYDDFGYAKRAISYEVADYLLKPVTSYELTEELCKVRSKIEDSQKQQSEIDHIKTELEKNVPTLRSHFLTRIVEGSYQKHDIREQMQKLQIVTGGKRQAVVMLEVEEWPGYFRKSNGSGEELMEFVVANISGEMAECNHHVLVFQNDQSQSILIFSENEEEQLQRCIKEFCNKVISVIQEYMEARIRVLVGKTVEGVQNWKFSYESVIQAREHKFLFEGQEFIYGQDVLLKKDTQEAPFIHQLDQLILMIKMSNLDEISTEITNIFTSLRNSGKDNKQLLVIIQNLVLMILMGVEEHLQEQKEAYNKEAFILQLSAQKHLRGIEKQFRQFCFKLAEAIARRRENANEKQAVKAIDYIEKNYMNVDMSLNMVCDYLAVSTSYFSAIFKNATGETFIEALTRVRINKAKELLESTDMRNYEVAIQVGYQDPHYFSSIFKKRTGSTPKEYAKQLCGRK